MVRRMSTTVKFVEAPDGGISTVEVHSLGTTTMMVDLVRALFDLRVEVLIAESHSLPNGRVERFRIRGEGGSSLDAARGRELRTAVLEVIERNLWRRRRDTARQTAISDRSAADRSDGLVALA